MVSEYSYRVLEYYVQRTCFRFAGVVLVALHVALVLLDLRALLCVVLRCLAFVLCVPVGMS